MQSPAVSELMIGTYLQYLGLFQDYDPDLACIKYHHNRWVMSAFAKVGLPCGPCCAWFLRTLAGRWGLAAFVW